MEDKRKLTFGEIKIGDKFIDFPSPRYRDDYHILVKIGGNSGPAANNAVDLVDGQLCYYPAGMWVSGSSSSDFAEQIY